MTQSDQSDILSIAVGLIATVARYRLALEVIAGCSEDYSTGGAGMIAVAEQALKPPEER